MRHLTALAMLAPVVAFPNDSAIVGVGGSFKSMAEHPSVRMVEETIYLIPAKGKVRVDFVFRNESQRATKVLMGFPESGSGDIDSHAALKRSGFDTFTTRVDGKRVSARREFVHEDGSYQAHWIKSVDFAPRQTRRVRVEYTARPGASASGERFQAYVVSTGASWNGKIDRIRVFIDLSGISTKSPRFYPATVRRRGSHAYIEYRDVEPTRAHNLTVVWKK